MRQLEATPGASDELYANDSSTRGRSDRALINAALAVLQASTAEAACAALSERARALIGADTVVVGGCDAHVGPWAASSVLVPIVAGGPAPIKLQAAWRDRRPPGHLEAVAETLGTLAALTRPVFRPRTESAHAVDTQQLVQSGKLAAIGELAAGVAHEINNPLFAILGLTEFLLEDAQPGSKERERLELIRTTGLEIKDIVRSLLEFARERSDERATVCLADAARQTVELFRRTSSAKQLEFVERYAGEPALVHASANQLKQVFVNLLSNARRAMPEGGRVSVEVGRVGDSAVARVVDSGPGIPADVLERIFEPFFTTRRDEGGTGLGLSVSLGIAQAHGGTLTVQSRPGEGSRFTLSLPVAEAAT